VGTATSVLKHVREDQSSLRDRVRFSRLTQR
jgi:hypothetical protein